MSGSPLDRLAKRLERRLEVMETRASERQDRIVFVVDDEPANAEALVRTLQDRYQVQAFHRGADLLNALKDGARPDLVVTDQRMPEMMGVELLERVRELLPGCVGIILSGYTEKADLIGAINRSRAFQYLTKPCGSDILLAAVKRGLEHAQALLDRERLTAHLQGSNQTLSATNGQLQQRLDSSTQELEQVRAALDRGGVAPALEVDPLAGVYDERHFRGCLANELRRNARYGTPVSLLIVRLSGASGVPVPEGLSARLMARLRAEVRDLDVMSRHGPGEVALLLPHSGPEGAQECARRLLSKLGELELEGTKLWGRVGMATVPEGPPGTGKPYPWADLLERARRALSRTGDGPAALCAE